MSRDLRDLLNRRRDEDADLRPARYVKPEGAGFHVVELIDTSERVIVGSLVGNRTYRPGTIVLLGTYQGGRLRAIIGLAPPGDQGASSFPEDAISSTGRELAKIISVIPSAVIAAQVDQLVYFVGTGLQEDPLDVIAAVVSAGGELTGDPYVTIHDLAWVSDPSGVGLAGLASNFAVIAGLVDAAAATPDGYAVTLAVNGSVSPAANTAPIFQWSPSVDVDFNGTSDIVNIGTDGDSMLPPFSLCAWVNPDTITSGTIIARRDGSSHQWQLYLISGGRLALKETDGGSWPSNASLGTPTTALSVGGWQHVTVTVNAAGDPTFYRTSTSGVQVTEAGTESGGHFAARVIDTTIGARLPMPGAYFLNGRLQDVRGYDRVLSSSEIVAIAASTVLP